MEKMSAVKEILFMVSTFSSSVLKFEMDGLLLCWPLLNSSSLAASIPTLFRDVGVQAGNIHCNQKAIWWELPYYI